MNQSLLKTSQNINVLACVQEKNKDFLNSYFANIFYKEKCSEINTELEQKQYDMFILDITEIQLIKILREQYPYLIIIIIIYNQSQKELNQLLQLPIGAIDIKEDSTLSHQTLQYYVKKINTQKSTLEKIISLEDKIAEFEKLLKIYGENVIASITDKKGVIKYATKAFCNIGEYEMRDLIGKPHNIIRHKDMEKETFKKMWETIQTGKVWKGEIKNKKKNGGFYWVYATVSPELNTSGEIIGYSAIRQDITDKKHIEQLSLTDGLTLLYNRRHFNNVVKQQLKLANRYELQLNFLLLDIDYFKQYNDTYGHVQGDTVLKSLAACMKNTFKRPNDLAFRLGGEEFGILFFTNSKKNALNLANKLKCNFENIKIEHSQNSVSKFVTFSAGIYAINTKDETPEGLIRKSDELLYKAKNSGRNKIVAYGEESP